MTLTAPINPALLPGLAKLRDLLELIAMLRDFREPLDSPEGLRRAIDLALRLGETLGLDPGWLAELRRTLENPRVFEIALALTRFAMSLIKPAPAPALQTREVTAESLATWLAILADLLALLRRFAN